MDNWEDATGAYEDAMNSSGTSLKAQETYSQTIEANMASLKASTQELWNDTISKDFVNGFIDAGDAIVNMVDDVGLLQTGLMGVSAVMSAKGVGGTNLYSCSQIKMPTIYCIAA